MKKIFFILIAVIALSTLKANSQILSITSVEKTADGNKVYFEIIVDTLHYTPGLLVSATNKNGRYDWGGNPNPYGIVTVGSVTTGYFLDEPIQGNKRRWYSLFYWDNNGNVILSPVFEYSGK